VLLDCGLFQGGRQTELRNLDTRPHEPASLAALALTHAHMDHSGLVPRLVRAGYGGLVYATPATCDLLKILWLDAAHIQEQEAIWKSRKNRRQGRREVEPLFNEDDARLAMTRLTPLDFNADHEIAPGLTLRLTPAGHILGAAGAHFTAREKGRQVRVAFSGDLGRASQLLMPPPTTPPPADTIFMETTYGNRRHKDLGPSVEEFLAIINTAWKEKGKILIPAFAVERTQEILLLLARAWHEDRLPRELPIILDSPLASAALGIYGDHQDLFDRDSQAFLNQWRGGQFLPTLRLTRNAEESQSLNDISGSALIMAGSGMANAGRILHHLKHNLWRPNCHVVFVGFQAQGTTGRRLVEGGRVVKIFREAVRVEAHIHTIGGFSGHADQAELLSLLAPQVRPGLTVDLIHGEPASTRDFQELARATFPEARFHIPNWLGYAALAEDAAGPGAEPAPSAELPPADPALAASFLNRLDRLRDRAPAAGTLPPDQLALLEQYLEQAESLLLAAGAD
jgi:metallo-beta-lactamase family protein